MPVYDAFTRIAWLLIEATTAALVLSLLVSFLAAKLTGTKFGETVSFVMPFGWLGTVSGLIAGSTKEAIVGALLTGMLTVVGAMLSYAFSKESAAEWRKLLPFSVVLLSVGALTGLSVGQNNRSQYENYEREYARWLLQYEKADLPAMLVRIRYNDCITKITPSSKPKCDDILSR